VPQFWQSPRGDAQLHYEIQLSQWRLGSTRCDSLHHLVCPGERGVRVEGKSRRVRTRRTSAGAAVRRMAGRLISRPGEGCLWHKGGLQNLAVYCQRWGLWGWEGADICNEISNILISKTLCRVKSESLSPPVRSLMRSVLKPANDRVATV